MSRAWGEDGVILDPWFSTEKGEVGLIWKLSGKLAAKQCAKERKAIGNDDFNELYGKPAMPNCLGVKAPEARAAVKGASKDCRAEREEIGPEAFA